MASPLSGSSWALKMVSGEVGDLLVAANATSRATPVRKGFSGKREAGRSVPGKRKKARWTVWARKRWEGK